MISKCTENFLFERNLVWVWNGIVCMEKRSSPRLFQMVFISILSAEIDEDLNNAVRTIQEAQEDQEAAVS